MHKVVIAKELGPVLAIDDGMVIEVRALLFDLVVFLSAVVRQQNNNE